MPQYDFDLFTIGGGSGGVAASRRAGSLGARVALCEDSQLGGTCVHRGCVPKKLLVYGAHFGEEFEDAAGFGWSLPERRFDWRKLQEAKERELERLEGVYQRLLRDAGVSILQGRGRVVDAHTVEVGGKRYTARHLLVATGSRPALPEDVRGLEHALTSDGALSLPELPHRVAIVGGGYIGVEFAGIFNALGSRVTLLLRDNQVLSGFDADVRSALTQELRKKGIFKASHTAFVTFEDVKDAVSTFGPGAVHVRPLMAPSKLHAKSYTTLTTRRWSRNLRQNQETLSGAKCRCQPGKGASAASSSWA